jgi:hypothetical protein
MLAYYGVTVLSLRVRVPLLPNLNHFTVFKVSYTNLQVCTVHLQINHFIVQIKHLIILNVVCIKTCNYLKHFKVS